MLIDKAGWLQHPDFIRIDGHPLKLYTAPNTGDGGLACHSVVGEEADFLDGVPNRFLDDSRNPDGSFTDAAAASCMFILRKRMPHIQMYPIWAATWTSGGRGANTSTWAMEAEGGGYIWLNGQLVSNFSEPLTEHQVRGFLIIATAWEQHKGKKLVVSKTVRPHWQLARDFGTASTACESGRYQYAWARLESGERADDEMTPEEKARLERVERLLAGRGIVPVTVSADNLQAIRMVKPGAQAGETVELSGADTLAYLDYQGNNFWLGLASTQAAARKALMYATSIAAAIAAAGVTISQL